jgi:alpha-ketoglutarate-dependent taurine dioxygenase
MRDNAGKTFHRMSESKEQVREIEQRTPAVTHDMVLENPATGQRSLYLSPNHTFAIEGLSEQDGRALVDALLAHALQDKLIYTHSWRNGDVVMWDNARLLHRRDAFDADLPRLAKRTTIYLDPAYFAVPEPGLHETVP